METPRVTLKKYPFSLLNCETFYMKFFKIMESEEEAYFMYLDFFSSASL